MYLEGRIWLIHEHEVTTCELNYPLRLVPRHFFLTLLVSRVASWIGLV